jgi:hypothetical protein
MDPDSDLDPPVFAIDLQDANKKTNLKKKFFCSLLFEGTFTSFFKNKKKTGSVHLTKGSGTRRPKNMWIRRIRICNTDFHASG